MQSPIAQEFFAERQKSELLFDQACAAI